MDLIRLVKELIRHQSRARARRARKRRRRSRVGLGLFYPENLNLTASDRNQRVAVLLLHQS
jgi:hypothetical protein